MHLLLSQDVLVKSAQGFLISLGVSGCVSVHNNISKTIKQLTLYLIRAFNLTQWFDFETKFNGQGECLGRVGVEVEILAK